MYKKNCRCPICGNSVYDHTYYEGPYVVEEHIECYRCNYNYSFAYGTYQESFGHYNFTWGYTLSEDNNERSRFFKKIERAKFMERRNYRKGLRNYNEKE